MPEEVEQLQRSIFKWVQAADDEARGTAKPVKAHATITAAEVARKYGIPEEKLRQHIKHEIEEEESCRSLPFTFLMFLSYTLVVLWHDPIIPITDVEDSVKFDIEENANFAFTSPYAGFKGFHDVNSYTDIWSFLIQGFVPLLFVQENSPAEGRDPTNPRIAASIKQVPRAERGYVLHWNRILGGVKFRQERGKYKECNSLKVLLPFYDRQCVGDLSGNGYELYPELYVAKYTNKPKREFWLWMQDDQDVLLKELRQKEKSGWLDQETAKLEIAVPVFNANLGVYAIVYVQFFFSLGGHIWKRVLPLSTYSSWWHGGHNILPDVLWIFGLLSLFIPESFKIIQTMSARTGGGLKGLWNEYVTLWNIVDWTTVICGFWIIAGYAMRFRATSMVNDEVVALGDIDEVTDQLAYRRQAQIVMDVLSKEVLAANDFRYILGVYPMLIVMRLFKAFAHQPRLSIVTRTLGKAGVDLVHFLLVFLSIFITFAIAGVVLFGREVEGFVTIQRALTTCFRAMMGDFDWDDLLRVGRFEAGIWFGSFMVIIVMIMLNMLLAIVMESYSDVKQTISTGETMWEELVQAVTRFKGERYGELRSLKEVHRAVRSIKENKTFIKVQVSSANLSSGNLDANPNGRAKLKKSMSGVFQPVEEFCLVTVQSLMDACPKMQEEQAMELIQNAVMDVYRQNRGDTSIEEMCHSVRKVNFTTKRLKRHMNKSLQELQGVEGSSNFKMAGALAQPDGDEVVKQSLDPADLASFAENLYNCRLQLADARQWIGEQELHHVDAKKSLRPEQAEHMVLDAMQAEVLAETPDCTVRVVLEDEDTVLAACRDAGIGPENDRNRIRALGKPVRLMQKDIRDSTVKCRVPGIGDIWFGVGALGQLRPREPGEPVSKDALAEKVEDKRTNVDTAEHDSNYNMSIASSEVGESDKQTLLRRAHELEKDKFMAQQTVHEAINGVSELRWQQVKEKTDRSKLHAKVQGLKKKCISRARELRRLKQESVRQQERLDIVKSSRDEYMELVQNLRAEQFRWRERLARLQAPPSLKDMPRADMEAEFRQREEDYKDGRERGHRRHRDGGGNGDRGRYPEDNEDRYYPRNASPGGSDRSRERHRHRDDRQHRGESRERRDRR